MKAATSLKEKRLRLILPRADWQRLASVITVIESELTNYQQSLAESGRFNSSDRESPAQPDQLKLLSYLQSIWPKFEQLIERARSDEKNRVMITDAEAAELRLLNYCARYLPNTTIAWSEFQLALQPLLDALDFTILEQIMATTAPRPINCSIDDLKRGRKISHFATTNINQQKTADCDEANDEPTEIDGYDWNV